MSPQTIRDEVLLAWRHILTRAGIHPSELDHLVLELEQAAANRGARLPGRPRVEDPNAAALVKPPRDAWRTADVHADYQAARASLRAPEPPAPAPTTDHLPPLPDELDTKDPM